MGSFKEKIEKFYVKEGVKAYKYLLVIVPVAAMAIFCLYRGITFAIIGGFGLYGAVTLIPFGGLMVLALIFYLIPTYILTRREEKIGNNK